MENENEHTTDIPEMVSPAGISHYHPLTQAATSIHMAIDPKPDGNNDYWSCEGKTNEELEALAAELMATLEYEKIRELGDPSLIWATQARVLDAVFNRFITLGFAPLKNPDLDKIRFALMAQRQCTLALDKLNRRRRRKIPGS